MGIKNIKISIHRILLPALALLFLKGGVTAYAADNVELNLEKGDIVISSDGYTQDGGSKKDGPGTDGSYIITSNGEETGHVITVASGKKHSIIFNKVRIDTSTGNGYNPLYIAKDAKVELTIKGENILRSKEYAAIAVPEGAYLKITAQTDAVLEAVTGTAASGAGIGGTWKDNNGKDMANAGCGTIEINGGLIRTTGIGSANGSANSGALISSDSGSAWIEADYVNADKKEFTSGVLFDGNDGQVYGSYTLKNEDMKVEAGKTLTIGAEQMLEVPKKYPLTLDGMLFNHGTLRIGDENSLIGEGWIGGNGTFYILCGLTADMFEVPDRMLYSTGEDHTEYVKKFVQDSMKADGTVVVKGRIFNRIQEENWDMEIDPSKVVEKGNYTVTFTDPEDESNQVEKTFEVLDAGEMTGIELTTPPQKTQYTYGERFDKTGMVVTVKYSSGATKTAANSKVKVKDGSLYVGQTSVTLAYKENGKEGTCTVEIAVSPKEIDVSKINWEEKTVTSYAYDGEEKTLKFRAELPDGVIVSLGGISSATDVGNYALTIDYFLEEGYQNNYVLTGNTTVTAEWSITPKELEWDTIGLEAVGNTRDKEVYLYGELSVDGLLSSDSGDGLLRKTFQASELSGTHEDKAGDSQEVALEWKDTYNLPNLGAADSAGNYMLPEELPTVSGIINEVEKLPLPPEVKVLKDRAYRLDMENGVSRVPDGLTNQPNVDTPGEIEKSLIKAAMDKGVRQTYVDTYDLALLKKIKGNPDWERAGRDELPSEGLTVTIPYPAGITNKSYDCVVAYIYPFDIEWEEAGTIVYLDVEKKKDGIQFTIPAPAPISAGWKEIKK